MDYTSKGDIALLAWYKNYSEDWSLENKFQEMLPWDKEKWEANLIAEAS